MRYLFASLAMAISMGSVAQAELLMPTTYSTSVVDGTELQCPANKIMAVRQKDGKKIIDLCKKDRQNCMFEGSCVIRTLDGMIGITYVKYSEELEEAVFTKYDVGNCPFGIGYTGACVDPYFSVAADLNEYKIGEVLYIEKLKGLQLPTGEVHDGYVIVRDSSIYHMSGVGAEAVVFFTGFQNDRSAKNIFAKIGLSSNENLVESQRITDETKAQEVRKKRNFPQIPEHLSNIIHVENR